MKLLLNDTYVRSFLFRFFFFFFFFFLREKCIIILQTFFLFVLLFPNLFYIFNYFFLPFFFDCLTAYSIVSTCTANCYSLQINIYINLIFWQLYPRNKILLHASCLRYCMFRPPVWSIPYSIISWNTSPYWLTNRALRSLAWQNRRSRTLVHIKPNKLILLQ